MISSRPQVGVSMAAPTLTRGKLALRDGMVFLVLSAVTIALFTVTLFLFKSFEQRREDLARQWSQRGKAALQNGHPAQAVNALRTSLSYEGNGTEDQLLLAQALAEAGRLEEARSYFLNLRDAHPGDGFVNLQLARLARKQGDAQEAIDDYRASIFGNWQGDGAIRRREVRLELADYLAQRGNPAAAQVEILIAAGNAPEDSRSDQTFGDRLQAIGALPDALQFYQRSLASHPREPVLLAKAGRVAYKLGNYERAFRYLSEAEQAQPREALSDTERSELATLAANAKRIPELRITRDLPATERADHLVVAAQIARTRLSACSLQLHGPTDTQTAEPPQLATVKQGWTKLNERLRRSVLEKDAALEDQVMQLIDDTEAQTAAVCGQPKGDDALLLMLASSSHTSAQ